jgi:hypothetical protein
LSEAESAVCLPIPGGYTYFRCPHAALEGDPNVMHWLVRYFDCQRMNIRRGDIDDIPAMEIQAFRTIETAIHDTQRRDAATRAKKQEKEGKKPVGRAGGRTVPSARSRPVRRSSRGRR